MHIKLLSESLADLFHSQGEIRHYDKETYLFREGEEIQGLYLILTGKVKMSKLSNDGNQLTLRYVEPGGVAGELALLNDYAHYVLSAKVMESGEIAILSKSIIIDAIERNGLLALELIQIMNDRVRRDQTRFRDLVLFGKKGALYSTLIRLSNSYGETNGNDIFINIKMTDQQLADFCGTSRESINRLMGQLKKDSVLSTDKSFITIHDIDYLKEAINCADCPIDLCSIH